MPVSSVTGVNDMGYGGRPVYLLRGAPLGQWAIRPVGHYACTNGFTEHVCRRWSVPGPLQRLPPGARPFVVLTDRGRRSRCRGADVPASLTPVKGGGRRRPVSLLAVIDVAAVTEGDHDDKESIVSDGVDDAVVADADAKARSTAQRS
jgi:hypothetical protein